MIKRRIDMREYRTFILALLAGLWFTGNAHGQGDRELVLKAMEDELARSMSELKMEDHDRPFFITYRLTEGKSMSVGASLGALTSSTFQPQRTGSVRVMVGDYDFNDESFSGEYEEGFPIGPEIGGYQENEMPVGPDYIGIRRYFWTATDGVYKSAAKLFKSYQAKLKKEEKTIEETPHLVFNKVPPVVHMDPALTVEWDQQKMEERARKISALFLKHTEIKNSGVYLFHSLGRRYYINSEGARIIEEEVSLGLNIIMATDNRPGFYNGDRLTYSATSLNELPDDAKIEADIIAKIKEFEAEKELPKFEDIYEGPVLFYDEAVASLLSRYLPGSLYGSESASITEQESYRNPGTELDEKMGKRVISRDLSVAVLPGAENYKGQKMEGAYRFDNEGVKATDSLLLIDKGYLKDLMRSRNGLNDAPGPNGTGRGAGVLSVVSHHTETEEKLKQMLIEMAEDEGMEFALIIRKLSQSESGVNVYKVSLEDGSETLMQSASLSDLDFNSFRKVGGTSADRRIEQKAGGLYGSNISVIAPRIFLLEDVEVEPFRSYGMPKTKEPLVESPLVREK
jgi:predicted Zn-dependent protease